MLLGPFVFMAIVILIVVNQSCIGVLTATDRPLKHKSIIMFINSLVMIKLNRYHGDAEQKVGHLSLPTERHLTVLLSSNHWRSGRPIHMIWL